MPRAALLPLRTLPPPRAKVMLDPANADDDPAAEAAADPANEAEVP
jgi:hypothetical protein